MKHKANNRAVLRSERLLLRPLCADDAQAVFDHWASDAQVSRFLRWAAHRSVEESAAWLAETEEMYAGGQDYNYGMERLDDGRLIGSIGAFYSAEHDRYEVGYCMERALWNRGYMSEALARMLRFLIEEEKIKRFVCSHAPENPASGKVMQKCGFVFQNRTEPCFSNSGNFLYDALVYHLDAT